MFRNLLRRFYPQFGVIGQLEFQTCLSNEFGLMVPDEWNMEIEKEVLADDIIIHNCNEKLDFYLTGGQKSGLFYCRDHDQTYLKDASKILWNFPFDAFASKSKTLYHLGNSDMVDDLRQSRIIEQFKEEWL